MSSVSQALLEEAKKMTPEEFAELIRLQKPHLLAIEEHVQRMKDGYGELQLKLDVRAYKVVGFKVVTEDKWLLTADKK